MKKLITLALLIACCAAFALPASAATTYEIRQKNTYPAARIVLVGEEYLNTNINYISLEHPITITKGTQNMLAIGYTTANTGRQTTQFIDLCPVLQLTSEYWPHITVNGSFDGQLIVNGGEVSAMRIDGGTVIFDGVTVAGRIELRGENTAVAFDGCTFEEGAEIHASPTVTVTVDGDKVEP